MKSVTDDENENFITNYNLLLPYLGPYFAYVGIASLFQDRMPIEWNYIIRIVVVTALLCWAWIWYIPLTGPRNKFVSIVTGIIAGLFGTVVWIVLLKPFVNPFEGAAWSNTGFCLRLLSASLIVPVFEELAMRGYIFRIALQWDMARKNKIAASFEEALDKSSIDDVAPGAWSIWAVVISTTAFTLGHNTCEWPAAIAYGLLMSLLWIIRKDLLSCVVAHGITNFVLALYVHSTGQWGLW